MEPVVARVEAVVVVLPHLLMTLPRPLALLCGWKAKKKQNKKNTSYLAQENEAKQHVCLNAVVKVTASGPKEAVVILAFPLSVCPLFSSRRIDCFLMNKIIVMFPLTSWKRDAVTEASLSSMNYQVSFIHHFSAQN